jgi:hypothetical protein
VSLLNSKRKACGPPVYQHGLFELIIDPSENSLDNTFKGRDIVVILSVQADTGQLLQFTLMLIHSLGTDAPLSPAAYS